VADARRGIANTGTFAWTTPRSTIRSVRVRVTAYDREGSPAPARPASDLALLVPPQIALGAPSGGDSWVAGTRRQIRWTATDDIGVTAIDVDWSADGGGDVATARRRTRERRRLSWITPVSAIPHNRVRVTAHDGDGMTAQVATRGRLRDRARGPRPRARARRYAWALSAEEHRRRHDVALANQERAGGARALRRDASDAEHSGGRARGHARHEVTISGLPAGTRCY
jgi:hypothetical protein